MNRSLFVISLLLVFQYGFAQDMVSELFGLKLNQFRDVVTKSEFGTPLQKRTFDDGFEMELFLLKPDSSAYVILEYPDTDKNTIWSIQLYGDDENLDPRFKGLKMGQSKEEVIKQLGTPSKETDIGEYGEFLEYENTNYSVEINTQNRLSSIKIKELYQYTFPEPDPSKIPSIQELLQVLGGSNEEISKVLSPGLEISSKDGYKVFERAWQKEIEKDYSGLYAAIRKAFEGLDQVDFSNLDEFEENMRLRQNENIKHAYKFKKHPNIEEIVLKWEFGQFLIWEIRLR